MQSKSQTNGQTLLLFQSCEWMGQTLCQEISCELKQFARLKLNSSNEMNR
jgi:hypothetical protein